MRMNAVGKGLKRRGKLMAQALGPPRRAPRSTNTPARTAVSPGYTAPRAPRLVGSPVFVLSSVRSGSTLLRVLLNSHPEIRAPHEMHLRTLRVDLTRPYSARAMEGLELDRRELEHLLWDRVLHMELERSGKRVIVDKTPANALIRDRLSDCWPDARFLVLLRHPGAVVSSLVNRRKEPDLDAIHAEVLDYGEALEAARTELGAAGHVLRYEELTAELLPRPPAASATSSASSGPRGCSTTARTTTAPSGRTWATGAATSSRAASSPRAPATTTPG